MCLLLSQVNLGNPIRGNGYDTFGQILLILCLFSTFYKYNRSHYHKYVIIIVRKVRTNKVVTSIINIASFNNTRKLHVRQSLYGFDLTMQ